MSKFNNLVKTVQSRLDNIRELSTPNANTLIAQASHQLKSKMTDSIQQRLRPGITGWVDCMSGHLNRLTGYDQCLALKEAVQSKDREYGEARAQLHALRSAATAATEARSSCQRSINQLLQRKQAWTDADVGAFAALHHDELRLAAAESSAASQLQQGEQRLDRLFDELMTSMRERYQHEQTWSDKIRRASTMGTLGLMAANMLTFLFIQVWVEPRKKEALVEQIVARLSVPQQINSSSRSLASNGIAQVHAMTQPNVLDTTLFSRQRHMTDHIRRTHISSHHQDGRSHQGCRCLAHHLDDLTDASGNQHG